MSSENSSISTDCEIVSKRSIHFPVSIVFKVWADPRHLINWWGPKGFSNTFHEFDFRVGGKWNFTMHGPDRGHYPNECEFVQIEKPTLIAWRRISRPLFEVIARFEELSAFSTKIDFRMIFDSAKECSKVKRFAVEKNEENFDRLEAELARMSGE